MSKAIYFWDPFLLINNFGLITKSWERRHFLFFSDKVGWLKFSRLLLSWINQIGGYTWRDLGDCAWCIQSRWVNNITREWILPKIRADKFFRGGSGTRYSQWSFSSRLPRDVTESALMNSSNSIVPSWNNNPTFPYFVPAVAREMLFPIDRKLFENRELLADRVFQRQTATGLQLNLITIDHTLCK